MARVNKILNSPEVLKSKKFHNVTISQRDENGNYSPLINGSLQEGVSITYDPQYSTLGEMVGLPALNTLEQSAASIAGAQLFDVTTQKQYTGSSYIDITINIRVLDENGYGIPLKVASLLAAICQPIPYSDELFKKYKDQLVKFYNDITGGVGNTLGKALTGNFEGAFDEGKKTIDSIGKTLDAAALRVVKLSISDYLEFDEMVITNVSQNFSYEQSINGPLFADFAIQLSTLKVPDSSKVLNYYTPDKVERVTIE